MYMLKVGGEGESGREMIGVRVSKMRRRRAECGAQLRTKGAIVEGAVVWRRRRGYAAVNAFAVALMPQNYAWTCDPHPRVVARQRSTGVGVRMLAPLVALITKSIACLRVGILIPGPPHLPVESRIEALGPVP